MPVELIIQSGEYLNQYKNGDTFASSTSDVTNNLAATVMEKLQYNATLDVRWFFQASASAPVEREDLGSDLFKFKKMSGSFLDDGFSLGDNLQWDWTSGGQSYSRNGNITVIQTDWMYIQFTTSTVLGGTGTSTSSLFRGLSSLTALIYSFGLIDNNENFNTTSKVSGNNQSFYASGLTIGVPQVMTPQGTYRDWVTGTVIVTKQANPSTYVQRYDITHEFILNPYYLDGELSYLQNDIIRPLYSGQNSLKHVLECEFRTGLSNPNTSKIARLDWVLGSTGDYGENMNGFNNLYNVDSVTYENATANSADGILTAEETTIRVKISKVGGSFISTDKVGAFVSYLPEVTDYTDKITDFEENFIYSNAFCLADGVPVANTGVIDEVTATLNAGDIDLVIKTTYSTAQQTYLATNNGANFALAIQIGDVSLNNPDSDRVMIMADALPYDTSADISGLFTVNNMDYYLHDMDITGGGGVTAPVVWNEDGFTMEFDFDLDLSKAAFLNTLKVDLISIDTATLTEYILDSYEYQLGNIVSGGIQQFNVNDNRGYTLQSGSQFNKAELLTGALVGQLQNYTGVIGQKISWQEWIQNLDVDQIFYDSNEPNDNFNFKTSNYANGLNGHIIALAIRANVYGEDSTLGTSGNTIYEVITQNGITTYDYDEDNLSPSPRYTGTIETFTEDGLTNLGGAIQTNGDNTLVKTTWVDNTFTFTTLWNFWGIQRLEVTNAQGYAIEEFSSINTPPAGQILQPITGSTLLDMQIVGGNCVTQCLIDGSAINTNVTYKLSSRIQSPNKATTEDVVTFFHTNNVAINLTMTVVKTGATTEFDYGDGSAVDVTNVTNHSFPTLKETYLVSANVGNYADVTEWIAGNDQYSNAFDWSDLLNVTNFEVSDSNNLMNITNPTTATVMTNYDLSGSGVTTNDLTGLTGLAGIFDVNTSGNLNALILPASTQTFSLFDCYNCDLDYFDLTPLTNLTEATSVFINLGNNSMTAEEVNHFLVDLDAMSTGGFLTRTIKIDGSNAAPDGSSGGYDGTTAKANLISKSFTVTTN